MTELQGTALIDLVFSLGLYVCFLLGLIAGQQR
jgi:hypothetical protein